MAIILNLEPETESQLMAQAAAQGKSVEELLKALVEGLLSNTASSTSTILSPQKKAEKFVRWAESRTLTTAPPLSDEAISRESIYVREDEML
ncbi:MAG: hypothetical protein AAFW75_15600 [Cyanobacteria bacterium J06636_16]